MARQFTLPTSARIRAYLRALRKRRLGSRGEACACRYLRKNGYLILRRNWHWRRGELDIVAGLGHHLIAVEVKTRRSLWTLSTEQLVRTAQERKILRLLQAFRSQHPALVRRLLLWHDRADLVVILPSRWFGTTWLHVERHFEQYFSRL